MNQNVQFTGIVVTFNEARRLRDCLNSLAFCSELLVFDLGSSDESVKVAQNHGATIVRHKREPIVEIVQKKAIEYAKNDWIVFLDPDEVLPIGVENDLRTIIASDSYIGSVNMPWQFYFRGRPMHHTIWGGRRTKANVVFNKNRMKFTVDVHSGRKIKDGYKSITIPAKFENYHIRHYWVDSYPQLFEKHWRYIKEEGRKHFNSGLQFSFYKMMRGTKQAVTRNLVYNKAWAEGSTGLFLSIFYGWYVMMSWLSLWMYEMEMKQNLFKKSRKF
jgi:glycosyltransferase involved in cell wall biosynthesis